MSESVAQSLQHRVDSQTLLLSLCGQMESERIQRASERMWKFELLPWTPVPVCMSIAPTTFAFGERGQEKGVWGSAYCSASLCAADYDHHECQALKNRKEDCNPDVQMLLEENCEFVHQTCLCQTRSLTN